MIEQIKHIEGDWYLIHLKGTRNYQIWNKWDLFSTLLKATETDLINPKPYINLVDEDFPMSESVLTIIVNELKKIKENGINKN